MEDGERLQGRLRAVAGHRIRCETSPRVRGAADACCGGGAWDVDGVHRAGTRLERREGSHMACTSRGWLGSVL